MLTRAIRESISTLVSCNNFYFSLLQKHATTYMAFNHFIELGIVGLELGTLELINTMHLTQLELSS